MKFAELTHNHIRTLADSSAVFRRGEEYSASGMVSSIKFTGNRLSATVLGSSEYTVEILEKNGQLDCHCDCPYDGYVCKHIVAVLLEYLDKREKMANQALEHSLSLNKIGGYLLRLEKEDLVSLIIELIENQGVKDTKSLVLDKLEECLGEGEAEAEAQSDIYQEKYETLFTRAEEILDELNEYGMQDDDMEIEVSELLEEISEMFCANRLPEEMKREYIDRLFHYYDWGNCCVTDNLIENCFAVAQTDEDWRYLITKLNAGSEAPGDYRKHLVMKIYRDCLRDDEAFLKERLARMKYGMDYYELVVYYHDKGETTRAIELAEEGLAKGEGRVIDLIDYLKKHYQSLNDYANSLRLYRLAFQDEPCLTTYQAFKTFAHAADWPALEKECLKTMAVKSRKQELAKVHLYEKRNDEVLKYVQEANPGWYEQWDDFADAISSDYPGEIIEYYRAKVEWTIGGKSRGHYRQAVRYAEKMKKIYAELGRSAEFYEYITQIRRAFPKHRALLEEFGRLM